MPATQGTDLLSQSPKVRYVASDPAGWIKSAGQAIPAGPSQAPPADHHIVHAGEYACKTECLLLFLLPGSPCSISQDTQGAVLGMN
ncbi:hypothetical protein HOC_19526 [Hyphomonas oceanitis SCH89]|uniref:Uncharacterized protein n=1 Tax=Hyphomonas oceanitis SCH89 TaxID=1280953 RepID=A0A059G2D9_9PROT|nr:hypothetical protein HOC_19526 [Hyphomonas oceanitis SCH89]